MHVPAMKPIGQAMMVVVGLLIGLMLVSPPISAQLNRISPAQITCAAGRILAGGTPTTCTATPIVTSIGVGAGSAATPAVQIAAGPGLYSSAGNLFFSVGSSNVAQVDATGVTVNASNGRFAIANAAMVQSSADKLLQVKDSAAATGLELNAGTPTLGTCTGGSMTSGSHNSALEVTGNTSGSCVINFGTPNFTNAPFCTLNDESALIAIQISSRSNSSITVTGAASGNTFQVLCLGTIGT